VGAAQTSPVKRGTESGTAASLAAGREAPEPYSQRSMTTRVSV